MIMVKKEKLVPEGEEIEEEWIRERRRENGSERRGGYGGDGEDGDE